MTYHNRRADTLDRLTKLLFVPKSFSRDERRAVRDALLLCAVTIHQAVQDEPFDTDRINQLLLGMTDLLEGNG